MEIDTEFTLNGLMDVGDGNVLVHGIFHLASTGNLTITGGSIYCRWAALSCKKLGIY